MDRKLFLIAGKPGSGKSTASALVVQRLNKTSTFSIGDELRAIGLHGKPSGVSGALKGYAAQLRLHQPVPPSLTTEVFEECVGDSPEGIVIADGYPQYANLLPGFYSSIEHMGVTVLAVCEITLPDSIARVRLRARKQRTAEVAEDEAYIENRLKIYRDNARPTIDALAERYPLSVIDGSQTQEDMADDLMKAILNRAS